MNPIYRLNSFVKNITDLSKFMGYLPAFCYVITSRNKPDEIAYGNYKGQKFCFRRRDIPVIREIFYSGEYDFLIPALQKETAPFVFDVGAHIGVFSIWVHSINPKAKIVSIEASPETFQILSKNIACARSQGRMWEAHHSAAWKSDGSIAFENSHQSTMSHKVSDAGSIHVPSISLASVIHQFSGGQKIDVMKIDIEGAEEAFVVSGGPGPFNVVQSVVIELHPKMCDTDKVSETLMTRFSVLNVKSHKPQSKPLLYCTAT